MYTAFMEEIRAAYDTDKIQGVSERSAKSTIMRFLLTYV